MGEGVFEGGGEAAGGADFAAEGLEVGGDVKARFHRMGVVPGFQEGVCFGCETGKRIRSKTGEGIGGEAAKRVGLICETEEVGCCGDVREWDGVGQWLGTIGVEFGGVFLDGAEVAEGGRPMG